VISRVKKKFPQVEYFHMANSAAVLTFPEAHFNMVRPGISLYGVTPHDEPLER
jgi:alanine racemase